MEKKKVLVINTLGLKYEGITSVIYNYAKNINKKQFDMTFLAYSNIDTKLLEQFKEIGDVQYIANRKKKTISYICGLIKILKKKYNIVHINGNSSTMIIEAFLAKMFKVKNVIVHTHSVQSRYPVVNKILRGPMKVLADNLLACSDEAGNWLYGKSAFTVMNNAIDTSRYSYNYSDRLLYRKEFDIKEEIVVGHSGRFNIPKNHEFVIDSFALFHKHVNNSKLLLLSEGSTYEEMKKKVARMGLSDCVIFAGSRSDAARIYNAMDLFVFPSKYEGLGIVLLEAQVNGLPCIASFGVPEIANISDEVQYLDLDLDDWCKCMIDMTQTLEYDRYKQSVINSDKLRQKGFDIIKQSVELEAIYKN